MLTNCAFQLSFGKFYSFFNVKWTFLISIAWFEVGSAICGAAPSSTAFIIGRAIAGVGSAGIMSGTITVIVYAVPLHKRPIFQGLFGAVFGLASVIGPLLGGAFTTHVTWRWCFYINLPFGGVAMVAIFFLLTVPQRAPELLPLREKLAQLDGLGIFFFLPAVICLLLALQWGGSTYEWGSGRIIALLVLAGLLAAAFVAVQILRPDTATIPPRIFFQRSIMAGFYSTICVGASMMIFVYYLPVWFQAIENVSAVDSGIRLLPLVLSMVVASIMSGALTARIGYYTPFIIFGVVLLSIGAGLLTTLQVDTSEGRWLGFQIIYGFGMGCSFQAPNLAAQTVLPTRDVPVGTSLMIFSQLLGGAIFTSVGSNLLTSELLTRTAGIAGVTPEQILSSGATQLVATVPAGSLPAVLSAYNESLRVVFRVGLIMTCLTIFGALSLEWRSVKSKKKAAQGADDAAAAEEGAAAGTAGDAPAHGKDSVEEPVVPRRSSDASLSAEEKERRGSEKSDA